MSAIEEIRRSGDGVTNATHDLYRQYGRQIYAYCFHRLRSKEEAEDAVQTTFMNAFRSLQRGASTQFEQAWLYKIAQNVCIERHTASSRRLSLEAPSDLDQLQETVATPFGDGSLELLGIDEALEAMPENQRRAIVLREWQGLSYREIGEELQLSQAAVEMLIFRARRSLAGALEQPDQSGRRPARAGRKVGSLGSLVGLLKTLLGGGAAIKTAAVAAAAAIAVVGESAQHTIVRHATRSSATVVRPVAASRPHAVTAVVHEAAAPSVVTARPSVVRAGRRTAAPAPAATARTEPAAPTVVTPAAPVVAAPTVAAPPVAAPPVAAPPVAASSPVAASPPAAPAPAPVDPTPQPQPYPQPQPHERAPKPVAAKPAGTTTTTTTDPQPARGNDEHGHRGKDKDKGAVDAPLLVATTPSAPPLPTATAAPAPVGDPQPAFGNDERGHRGRGKGAVEPAVLVVAITPAPTPPPPTATVIVTTTTAATAVPPAPAPPAVAPEPQPVDPRPAHGNERWQFRHP